MWAFWSEAGSRALYEQRSVGWVVREALEDLREETSRFRQEQLKLLEESDLHH